MKSSVHNDFPVRGVQRLALTFANNRSRQAALQQPCGLHPSCKPDRDKLNGGVDAQSDIPGVVSRYGGYIAPCLASICKSSARFFAPNLARARKSKTFTVEWAMPRS